MAGPLTQLTANTKGLVDPTDPSFSGWVKYMLSLPEQADASAEATFPGSARDSSIKNAYRHSLGTGLLAQNLGASDGGLKGALAAAFAKLAGYGWEAAGGYKNLTEHGAMTDAEHDLNANAIGARAAMQTDDPNVLAQVLMEKASKSRIERPPMTWQSSPGYMTRTVK